MKSEICLLSLVVLVSCAAFTSARYERDPVPLKQLAKIIYAGNCTQDDLDPAIFAECALYTCWKSPDDGYIAKQRFGCHEDVPCHEEVRNNIIRWDRVWPGCCPSPICLEKSVANWLGVHN